MPRSSECQSNRKLLKSVCVTASYYQASAERPEKTSQFGYFKTKATDAQLIFKPVIHLRIIIKKKCEKEIVFVICYCRFHSEHF